VIKLHKTALTEKQKKTQAEALKYGQNLHNNVHNGDLEKTKVDFLASEYSDFWNFVSQHLEPIRANDKRFIEYPTIVPWYKVEENDEYWPAYEVLLEEKGWGKAIGEIRSTTLALMDRIPNPNNAEVSNSHGMVVGRVQSGKTAHFTGVIARAADKGYNFIIVLSGMYNNLRNQTQCRMDRELTGELQEGYCVPPPSNEWICLTNSDSDFDNTQSPSCLIEPARPMIAIVKKNPTSLNKLRTWLKSNPSKVKQLKLLLIDDEADYASVNTANKIMPAAEETLEDENEKELSQEELEEEENCTTINAYVRSIRNMFDKYAYIGYTATPYANVFIDPEDDGAEFDFEDGGGFEKLGKTLYPRQFITALKKPSGYLGIEDLFPSKPKNNQISHAEIISDETDDLHNQFTDIKELDSLKIPGSLYLALIDYCLAGAARSATTNDWNETHHSMMIHISSKAPLNLPLARRVKHTITHWSNLWFDEGDSIISKLRKDMSDRWGDKFRDDVNNHWKEKINLSLLFDEYMSDFLEEIEFSILNDKKSEASEIAEEEGFDIELDFEERGQDGWKVIVIGGDLLSRGLTIEGLCTSYFVREARNYDTLTQMGRFFGIRRYAPFVKIHTTGKLLGWFTWLGSVEKDLRDEIEHYAKTGQSPLDFAVRVLRHDIEGGMLPTDRNKMRRVKKVDRGLQKTSTQTRFLPLDSVKDLKKNITLAQKLLQHAQKYNSAKEVSGHWLWEDIDVSFIDDFFASSTFNSRSWNKEGVRGYIRRINEGKKNILSKWSIVLINNPQASTKIVPFNNLNDIKIGMSTRGRPTNTSNQIAELITAEHTAIDLWGSNGSSHKKGDFQATNANGNKAFSRRLMWEKREDSQPCLLLYVIDPQAQANVKGHADLFEDKLNKPNVLGISVILPDMQLTDEEKEKIRSYYRLEDMAGSNKGN
jgi:hypothetical protein